MRHTAARRLLKMIGRKPVIIGSSELLKECPGAPRQSQDLLALSLRERRGDVCHGLTDDDCDLWSDQPGDQKRQSHPKRRRVENGDANSQQKCDRQSRRHLDPNFVTRVQCRCARSIRRSCPLQHFSARNQQTSQRGADCAQHQQGFIRQKKNSQRPACERKPS